MQIAGAPDSPFGCRRATIPPVVAQSSDSVAEGRGKREPETVDVGTPVTQLRNDDYMEPSAIGGYSQVGLGAITEFAALSARASLKPRFRFARC